MIKKLLNFIFALAFVFVFSAISGESCSFASGISQIESGIIQGAKGGGSSFDDLLKQVNKVDISTPKDGAVFWTGYRQGN